MDDEIKTDSQFLADAKKKINDWFGYWGVNNTNAQEDRNFLFQTQWDSAEVADNRVLGKAQLQFNKLYDFYRRAITEQRKNTVSIEIRATESATEVDQDTIDLHEGILRAIAYDNKAAEVYQQAFSTQLHSGFGAILVRGDWENENSFNQKIVIESFDNPEKCFWDPNAKLPDKSDSEYCGVYTSYTKEAFKKLYPDIDPHTISNVNVGQSNFSWTTYNTVTIAEYWYKEHYEEMIYLLRNGRTVTKKEYGELREQAAEAALSGLTEEEIALIEYGMEIERKRKSSKVRIKHAVISGDQCIESPSDWPGKHLPLIYVDGDSYWDREQQYTQTFIKHAKDAQRFLNYCAIEIATALKNSRREQWIATPENIKGFEKIWKNPEKQQGILLANVDARSGLPQKTPPAELPQTLLQQYQRAEFDLQSILGMYEASRGMQGNETSGVAIANRAKQAESSMFIFFDNLNRAIESVGRIILDLMPQIYDTERRVQVTDQNGNKREVQVNQYDPITDTYHNEIKDYNWAIECKVGASTETQKQEALQTLVELTRVSPDTFPMVADLIAENIDLINTPQLVERFKNFVPPDVLAKEANEPPPPKQPSPQEQMMQAQVQLEQQKLQVEQEKVQIDMAKAKIEELKAMAALQEIPMEAEVAHVRAAAEIDKAHSELERDKIKAFTEATKIMSDLEKTRRGAH